MPKRDMPQPHLDAPLAVFLRQRRTELGMTQRQVAKVIGVSSPAYLYWERGMRKPSSENIHKLAEAMDINPGDLIALLTGEQNDN